MNRAGDLAAVRQMLMRAAQTVPGSKSVAEAAQRAADATNSTLRSAHVPATARVVTRGKGVRVELVQTGRITQRFTGKTPRQLLRDNVAKEMTRAKQEIRDEAVRVLQP